VFKAQIIGNVGKDPEMRYSANGSPFLRFSLAGNYRTRNAEGEWEDQTEWVRVTVFGQRAEALQDRIAKGSRLYVDGRLEAKPWTDQQGNVRAGLEVLADTIEFMSQQRTDGDGEQRRRQPTSGARSSAAATAPASPATAAGGRRPRRSAVLMDRRIAIAGGMVMLAAGALLVSMTKLHLTEVSVAVKVHRLVTFYCIEPHCAGWWIYGPDLAVLPETHMKRWDNVRWPDRARS
jgi:single-strand DNA-binding protein